MKRLVEQLATEHTLATAALEQLLEAATHDIDLLQYLRENAVRTAREQFGRGIYIRALIELSSHCYRNCLYCGLRRSNTRAERYRLTQEEVLRCCEEGYRLGFRTFVLQAGEDITHTDEWLVQLITQMRQRYPDAAITLSLGERSEASYLKLRQAGADRYLLRHEAANEELYASLHPHGHGLRHRLACVEALQRTGYQVGMGMMIGVKEQSLRHLAEDLLLMAQMRPEMVGIGPFIPHPDTPLGHEPAGKLNLTLATIAIARLLLPQTLIPATTALATLSPTGRTEGILSGANVVMPNLSPTDVRAKYAIYENKAAWGTEAAEGLASLEVELHTIGYHIDYGRGDSPRSLLTYPTNDTSVTAFSTTRHGGCGSGTYGTFNCTPYTEDNPDAVHKNQGQLCRMLGIPTDRLILPYQTHSCNILRIDDDFMQRSSDERHALLQEKDAVMTSLEEVCLCVSTADCIPILLYDHTHKAIAAVHAGWRGTVGRIAEQTLQAMHDTYGTKYANIEAFIGPGISLEAFEVGIEVYRAFEVAGFDMNGIAQWHEEKGKYHLDLPAANRMQLEAMGVKAERIYDSKICTYTSHHDFFSARRLGIKSGRILSGIMIKK